ncbi:predicted protein [Lichtheimia corymbifera JMRC:FSU:9682]|uniref:Uncharacterized protein n=1 Tax=Lichtheimia corymbifera JMRC:FSU:9682 TaxID=1263082 RepID=A0A068SAQ3_9FUNG|nr:predicted protein [Lichtheimia corymbifera JMRC:FSU:9682]
MKRGFFIMLTLIDMPDSTLWESFKLVVGNLEVMGRSSYIYFHPFIIGRSRSNSHNEACDFNINGVDQHVDAHGLTKFGVGDGQSRGCGLCTPLAFRPSIVSPVFEPPDSSNIVMNVRQVVWLCLTYSIYTSSASSSLSFLSIFSAAHSSTTTTRERCSASTHHGNPTTVLIRLSLTEWGTHYTLHSQPLPARHDTANGHDTFNTIQQRVTKATSDRVSAPQSTLLICNSWFPRGLCFPAFAPCIDHYHHLSMSPLVKPSNNKLKISIFGVGYPGKLHGTMRFIVWMMVPYQHLLEYATGLWYSITAYSASYSMATERCLDDLHSTASPLDQSILLFRDQPTLLLLDHAKYTWTMPSIPGSATSFSW